MAQTLAEFVAVSEDLLKRSQRFAYMSRAEELQHEAAEALCVNGQEVEARLHEAQERVDEDEANMLLALGLVLRCLESELRMFISLKEEQPGQAWDQLISAQNTLSSALRIRPEIEGMDHYVDHLALHEENLFPPQHFLSPAMTVGYSECSICASAYGECKHVAGRAYMGELCARVISEVTEVREISLVKEPKDKRRRIISITDDDGVTRDFLSWKRVEAGSSGQG